MKVEISQSFFYEAWTVSSDFGTSTSYRIYMKVLDPGEEYRVSETIDL